MLKNEAWREMSNEELEKEYSPSMWSVRLPVDKVVEEHDRVAAERSDEARKAVPCRLDIPYGSEPRRKVDVYGEDLPKDSIVFVYIHGGYWQALDKHVSSYAVQPLYRNGMVVVVADYQLAPSVSVETIVTEARSAIAWACDFAKGRGSRGVVLAGHSAGGHLITKTLATGGPEEVDLKKHKDVIKGIIPVSGVFDLRPLVRTSVNEPLKLTESSAWQVSPMRDFKEIAVDWRDVKCLVAVGDHDSPEFQRQSEEFYKTCIEAGLAAEYLLVDSVDHFNIVLDLSLEEFSFTKKIITFTKESCI